MNEILVIIILIVIVAVLFIHSLTLERKLNDALSKKQSQSTRYGQIFEQMIPFSNDFPFDPKNFRFLGNPIDGIVFEDDKITFCEIKLNNSTMTPKQKNIKSLVEDKKVYWKEIRSQ
jgi:predicted Holliday junction resolvase-like endonuclease